MNFKISHPLLNRLLLELVSTKKEAYGTNTSGAGKTIIIEFSSPNIAKPFHAGHLRSTIIGSFVSNVYDANGWKTIKMNYLGDWGKQYGRCFYIECLFYYVVLFYLSTTIFTLFGRREERGRRRKRASRTCRRRRAYHISNVLMRFFFFFPFAGLLAVGYNKYGNEELLNEDPTKHLYDVYVKINVS